MAAEAAEGVQHPQAGYFWSHVARLAARTGNEMVRAEAATKASLLAPDRFGSLLALGLTMMVLLQALVNISVVLGMLPTKGIPLPFVSNGGSSLVINLVAMGILLNISQQRSPLAAAA